MLLEKAWTIYLLDHVDKPTNDPRSYRRTDASVNMDRTTVGKACLAIGGWNGTATDAVLVEPSGKGDLDHKVHRYYTGKVEIEDHAAARDVKIAREHLLLSDGTFETATLMWTNGVPKGCRKPYEVPLVIGEKHGAGFSPSQAKQIIEHVREGYPCALAVRNFTSLTPLAS